MTAQRKHFFAPGGIIKHRRPAPYVDRYLHLWLSSNGRRVRFLWFDDYSLCAGGGEPRVYCKRLTRHGYPPGERVSGPFYEQLVDQLIPGQWTEVVIGWPAS